MSESSERLLQGWPPEGAEYSDGELFPTFAVDYVPSVYVYPGQVKINFARMDLDPFARPNQPPVISAVAQLIMALPVFVNMVAFFQQKVEEMVDTKAVTREEVEVLRKHYADLYAELKRRADVQNVG